MSGYCPDCGNTLCICKELEALEPPVSEEKKKTWQVTLPYDDVRGMEARSELLSDIKTHLMVYLNNFHLDKEQQREIESMLNKINGTGDKS